MDRVIQASRLDWETVAKADSSSHARTLIALGALALIAAWVALLQGAWLQPPGIGATSLWDARTAAAASASLPRRLAGLAFEALRFAPLGLLAVYVFADRSLKLLRLLLVGLPAFGFGLACAAAALWLRDRGAGPPGPSDLVLPAFGVWLGVLVALALRRGLFALAFLPVKLAAAVVALSLLLGLLLAASLELAPVVPAAPPVGTAEKRELVALLHGKDPRTIAPGDTRTLRLPQRDVDRIVAWGLPLVVPVERARGRVLLGLADATRLEGSARVPGVGRWINLSVSFRARVERGRFELRQPRLRAGRFEAPHGLLDAVAPALAALVRGERRLRTVLPQVRDLHVEEGALVATYGRIEAPAGLLAGLVWGEGASEALREPVADQVRGILAALEAAPAGEVRFARAYETAFARARARGGSAVEENRAALLALALVLGSSRLTAVVGDVMDAAQAERAHALRAVTTLRGRADWTRHFSISSALTVLSAVAPSNAAGLLKEELDADGGSGFSFGDLLADRAGTSLGESATRDEAQAAALQSRLAGGFAVADFFPPATGLPEGIPDAELRTRYGGVGGPLYRRHADDIERRIAACAGYH
jgi:hypothetical protein